MKIREAAQQALEAMEKNTKHLPKVAPPLVDRIADCLVEDHIALMLENERLRAALAEPVQEPLADMAVFDLADELLYGGTNYGVLAFARAIERAHGIE